MAGRTHSYRLQVTWTGNTGAGTASSRGYSRSHRIEAPGKPTNIAGTIALEPSGAGTTEVVELEIKVKVPLIGGKLESLMADLVTKGMDKERTAGVAWLAGKGSMR